jgi:hypothetical protein
VDVPDGALELPAHPLEVPQVRHPDAFRSASLRISPLHESPELSRRGYDEFRFRGRDPEGGEFHGRCLSLAGVFPPKFSFVQNFVSEAGGRSAHRMGWALPGWSLPVGSHVCRVGIGCM